jgi:hypothetical protein
VGGVFAGADVGVAAAGVAVRADFAAVVAAVLALRRRRNKAKVERGEAAGDVTTCAPGAECGSF